MKLNLLNILKLSTLLLTLGVYPSIQAADIKIGYIDSERVNRDSAPAEQASKRLEKEFQPRVLELQKLDNQIKSQQSQLEKDALTVTESDRRKRETDLSRLIVDFQRKQREYTEDLNLRRNQELSGLLEKANKIIKQIAETDKYDIIFQEAVYRSARVDITDRVIKALSESK